jgi:Asp/Glu/hydantoin racemase
MIMGCTPLAMVATADPLQDTVTIPDVVHPVHSEALQACAAYT